MRTMKKGFTLIELLAVLAILAILIALIAPKVGDATGKAKRLSCANNMRTIVRAMQIYEDDLGESCVQALTDTTDIIFGQLYYKKDTSDGEKVGLTTMKIYNCPSTTSLPPQVNSLGYQNNLLAGPTNPGTIDYAIITMSDNATNVVPQFKVDVDKNAILLDRFKNHNGRNVAFWDSTIRFFGDGQVYASNIDPDTGIVMGNDIIANIGVARIIGETSPANPALSR